MKKLFLGIIASTMVMSCSTSTEDINMSVDNKASTFKAKDGIDEATIISVQEDLNSYLKTGYELTTNDSHVLCARRNSAGNGGTSYVSVDNPYGGPPTVWFVSYSDTPDKLEITVDIMKLADVSWNCEGLQGVGPVIYPKR